MSATGLELILKNATLWPSGENIGPKSPRVPAGGTVKACFSKLSVDTRKILWGPCDSVYGTAMNLPSGDQAKLGIIGQSGCGPNVTSVRAAPPEAATTKILTSL